jgi:phage gp29-like protein
VAQQNGQTPAQQIADRFGAQPAPRDDPAWQPPRDPLTMAIDAGVVRREIPIVTISTFWTPPRVRNAFADLVAGQFDSTAQLIDSMIGDSRICAGLDSRVGGLLGRPIEYSIPKRYKDSALAKECHEAFTEAWPTLAAESMLSGLQAWAILLGHGHAQIMWDTGGRYDIPVPRVWHPRYTYYDWTVRRIVAITQDGPVPIEAGDGHWILHAPHGEYRGWMRGAVRAIAPWWLSRNYALRDASRWSEVHGLPMVKLKHPATADRDMVNRFRQSMSNRGGETCVDLPQGVPEAGSAAGANANYDVEYLEATGQSFDGFFKLIDACDREITLALLAQTLTSSVGPEGRGSYAAARVHADVRQALLQADARALARTVYLQLARPFAFQNFGLADLAPVISWNIEPYEDALTKVNTFAILTQGLNVLRQAGIQVEDVGRLARMFGLDLGKISNITKGAEIYQYDLEYGIATVNEARARKGLPPIDGGDVPPRPATPDEDPGARARFAAAAAEHARLRIALGATPEEFEAETEALAAVLALREAPRRQARR